MSLTHTGRRNPCPICENTSGKCRQGKSDPDYWQCMTYADAKKGEVVGEYKCLGHTRDKLWGQFKPNNSHEWTEQKRREWQIENQRRKVAQAKVDEQRRQRSLSAVARHEQYTKLLAELILHPDDRADLITRGFTEDQILLCGFKSINRHHKLQSQYSELLPGVTATGTRLVIREEGYLCPIRNAEGFIVACQVRLRNLPTTETPRYKWLSSTGTTLHFFPKGGRPEGELPLPIHLPQKVSKFAIGICEGVGAKPFLAAQRLGIPFIGAAGGQHASSPEVFKESLQQIEDALWQVAQEIGLNSIAEAILQQRSQRESQFLASKGNSFGTQTYQRPSLNAGEKPKDLDTQQRSSCSTSNSFQWLKTQLLNSLQTILNSTDLKCNPSETQNYKLAGSQCPSQIEILITPDAGDILNSSVIGRWKRTIALLEEWGWLVKIAWWGQVDKLCPDIDELSDYSTIEYILPKNFKSWAEREEIGKSASTKISPKALLQSASIPNQLLSNDKSQRLGKQPSSKINQESYLSPQSTIFDISNPPLIASFPTRSLRDSMFKVLPIPESVASCLTTEEIAPGKTRRWFERILNRVKKVFSKNAKKATFLKLGFNCFKEPNPDFEEKIRQVQRKLRSLSYEADIELNCRYLPSELVNQLPKSGLIGIKAPKGCGKSVTLKKIIAQAKKQGIPVLSITPRIALGREQAIKWEITWIDDYGVMQTRAEDTARQVQEVAQKRSEAEARLSELEAISYQQLSLFTENQKEDIEQQKNDLRAEIELFGEQIENINAASIKTLALCWDSLWRTKDRDLKEALIVIDEAELGFKHFISGSTCKRNRPYLLKVFKDKLTECLMSGGRVILSDADLTDLPLNYVREILPIPIKPFIVKNEYIGDETKWVVDLRVGSRGDTLDEILEAARDGDYLAITTDSQAEAQALERRILQELSDDFCAFLDADGGITQEAQAGEKALIVRIDRTTTETEAGKRFIQKPNEQILHWKPRLLIYTPSMGVGVSIDEDTQRWDEDQQEMVPYFDVVYGLLFGVIEPSQCRQQLARFRANVPRIVYCKESNKALEGCSSFFPEEVKRQTLKYNHSALNILDIAKGIAGYDADDEEIRETMLKLLHEAWDKDSRCWKEPSIDLDAAFKARENYGLWNLANLLREELEDEGHTVVALAGMKTDLVEEVSNPGLLYTGLQLRN